jgi:uncharacterized protein
MTGPEKRMPAPAPAEGGLRPVGTKERIDLLDVLRGFALCGILFANMPIFMGYAFLGDEGRASLPFPAADHATTFLTHFLVEGKFYSLFSLLFGIGFSVQLLRARHDDKSFLPYYMRRLAILLCIGLAHLVLLWTGDILASYAACGFILLLFRRVSERTLLTWAAVLLLLPVLQYALVMLTGGTFHPGTPFEIAGMHARQRLGLFDAGTRLETMQGGYWLWLKGNAAGAFFRYSNLMYSGRFFKILAMFLLGFYVGRRQIVQRLDAHRPLLKRLLTVGLVLGIPGNLVLAWLMERGDDFPASGLGLTQTVVYALGVVPLSLAYAAAFSLAWQKPAWQKRLRVFSPLGKMALTNYLMQTVLCLLLFNGFGLGLAGRVGPFVGVGLIGLVLAFEWAFSRWWLSRYQFGPAEWLWRSLTYGKLQRLKLATAA